MENARQAEVTLRYIAILTMPHKLPSNTCMHEMGPSDRLAFSKNRLRACYGALCRSANGKTRNPVVTMALGKQSAELNDFKFFIW